jgi:ATP-dependent DNA helicase RecG
MSDFFTTKIEFLKGVGPQKALLLNSELKLFTFADLLQYYPFRYEDRSQFYKVSEVNAEMPYVQITGRVRNLQLTGQARAQRLTAVFSDETGSLELIWFKGIKYVAKNIREGQAYTLYGKPNLFNGKINIAHPEMAAPEQAAKGLQPVYSVTERLRNSYLDSKNMAKVMQELIERALAHIEETLPPYLCEKYKLISKRTALKNIHFPESHAFLEKARRRLKFEELFYVQLKLLRQKNKRKKELKGHVFRHVPTLTDFYKNHLPFDLTNAQKKVLREVYKDMSSGRQMNRLLQGDVGSGKTIVAFIAALMAIDNGAQACLMAPTEILAQQHYKGLKEFADLLQLSIGMLTGSTKKSERKILHEQLQSGAMHIIVGTHALLEDPVQFRNLGLCIIDEQHRFGVEQRSRLWRKNTVLIPHILVMTATPIPRTLAMTLYGDLDISVIDELPAGRKPIKTIHQYDKSRLKVFGFLRQQMDLGRQVYIVYPLIEESETMDYKDLMDGYESITRYFPEIPVSIVHGRMKSKDKDFEMQRFVKGETKIMVATTVIEVGVNVPNASVMVIENAERFGLSQLHQLRGRVGRGADQSYCLLMTGYKISKDSKTRIETMVKTNNGFEIADVDLKLRGPGDLTGTQQSGVLDLLIADLSQDAEIVKCAREEVIYILEEDIALELEQHVNIKKHISSLSRNAVNWSRIS